MDSNLPEKQSMSPAEFKELCWAARGGLDTVSLAEYTEEQLSGMRREKDTGEDEAQEEKIRVGTLELLKTLSVEERRELLTAHSDLDPEGLDRLAEAIEGYRDELVEATSAAKVTAVLAMVRVLRDLKTAAANNPTPVDVGPYVQVLRLRWEASRELRPISSRAIAREVGVDEKTIRRWDKRANELGVTPDAWDLRRLQAVVRPGRKEAK